MLEYRDGRRLPIVGSGYIGLEAAAVAARKGLRVTLVEVGERILARVASPETSGYVRDLHRREGDCTSFPWRDTRIRLECVQNAVDQAETVAADMMGRPANYVPIPWFWSDQFDAKLQIAGLSTGYDSIATRRAGDRAMSVWYYRGGRFCAVDAIDDPRAYMVGKQLLQASRTPDPAMVSDPSNDLKLLLP